MNKGPNSFLEKMVKILKQHDYKVIINQHILQVTSHHGILRPERIEEVKELANRYGYRIYAPKLYVLRKKEVRR